MKEFIGYSYDLNCSEMWSTPYDSFEECVDDAIDSALDDCIPTISIGKAYDIGRPAIDVENIIDGLCSQADDMYGEPACDYLNDFPRTLESELQDKLQNTFDTFCKNNNIELNVNAFIIDDEKEYKYCAYCKKLIHAGESYVESDLSAIDCEEDKCYFHEDCDYIPITHLMD